MFAVALMIMAAAVPLALMLSDENSDAVTVDYAKGLELRIFTENDDLGDVIYSGTVLPKSLDPSEWVKGSVDGTTWYNINASSEDYGEILTYGKAGLTHDQTLTAIAGSTCTLPLIQVTWTQLSDMPMDAYVDILKDGMSILVSDPAGSTYGPKMIGPVTITQAHYEHIRCAVSHEENRIKV